MTTAISTRQPAVTIEYDARGKRATRDFSGADISAAKRFFAAKLRDGKNPAVHGEGRADVMTPSGADPETAELNAAVAEAQATTDTGPATIKIPGVAPTAKTRGYVCGQVIGRAGLAAGITPDLIARADKAFGRANPRQTEFVLSIAWHAIRGALETIDAEKG